MREPCAGRGVQKPTQRQPTRATKLLVAKNPGQKLEETRHQSHYVEPAISSATRSQFSRRGGFSAFDGGRLGWKGRRRETGRRTSSARGKRKRKTAGTTRSRKGRHGHNERGVTRKQAARKAGLCGRTKYQRKAKRLPFLPLLPPRPQPCVLAGLRPALGIYPHFGESSMISAAARSLAPFRGWLGLPGLT